MGFNKNIYRRRVRAFVDVFGVESIIFREFGAETLKGGDIVTDFAGLLDLKIDKRVVRENESLSTEAIRLIYALNKIVGCLDQNQRVAQARWHCVRDIARMFPGKFTTPSELIRGYIEPEDVIWLRDTAKIDFTSCLEVDPFPDFESELERYLLSYEPETLEILVGGLMKRGIEATYEKDAKVSLMRLFLHHYAVLASQAKTA